MLTASVNGIELSYLLADFTDPWKAEREYLVLLHGWMGCKESWIRQTPFFARDFVVVVPDQRGFGQSSKPARGYAFEEYVRDIAGLLDVLGVKRAHLLGQSFGGIVAELFALLRPERTQSLILWATRSEPIGTLDMEVTAEFIRREGMPAFAEMFSARLADESEPEITEWNRQLVARGQPHVAIETLREVSKVNLTPELHRIEAPTLILASREDKVIPFEYAEKMQRNIPNSELYEYRGSHGAYLKTPDECNRVILQFLKGLPRQWKQE
jgi:pimeloyl-ACP methyl ester carboxylesterase